MAKQSFNLQVKKRDKKAGLNALRRSGLIPGVVYGHGFEAVEVEAPYNQFVKVYGEAGESSLIDLDVGGPASGGAGDKFKVLIQDIQSHPVSGRFLHFDLYHVKMTEKLEANIKLKFIGQSPAVQELGGILVKNLDELNVRCLPGDLVGDIEVDLGPLKNFGDVIKISDLKIPDGIEVLNSSDLIVASATEPAKEEEAPSAPVEEKVEAVEVIKKEKKEEEGEIEK